MDNERGVSVNIDEQLTRLETRGRTLRLSAVGVVVVLAFDACVAAAPPVDTPKGINPFEKALGRSTPTASKIRGVFVGVGKRRKLQEITVRRGTILKAQKRSVQIAIDGSAQTVLTSRLWIVNGKEPQRLNLDKPPNVGTPVDVGFVRKTAYVWIVELKRTPQPTRPEPRERRDDVKKKAVDPYEMIGKSQSGRLEVRVAAKVLYFSRPKEEGRWFPKPSEFVRMRFDGEPPLAGFFEIDGRPQKIQVTTETPEVASISSSGFFVELERPGKAVIVVTVGDEAATLKIEGVEAPFGLGVSTDDLIEAIGFPESRQEVSASWPESKSVDGMGYYPKAGDSISVEHWKFNEYPNAVFVVRYERLVRLHTAGVHRSY